MGLRRQRFVVLHQVFDLKKNIAEKGLLAAMFGKWAAAAAAPAAAAEQTCESRS
jgi:hypothetical protein